MKGTVLSFLLLGFFAVGISVQGSDADKAQNLRNCLDGFGTCDHSLLTSAQAKHLPIYSMTGTSGHV